MHFIIRQIHFLITWIKKKLSIKQFILFSSVLVGLSVGVAAVILKLFVHYIYVAITYQNFENNKYYFFILPILGILFTIIAVKKLLKGKIEKGLSIIHYAIAKKSSIIPSEQMYAQILTSSITVGFGGSAGLEAPIVITGAAFGSNYSRTYRLNHKERTLLLACGIAAGIAAAFNAPIAGVLFALEVLLVDISISAFTPLIIAAATGALISKIILQDDILLSFQLQQPFDYHNVPFYILLGLLAGVLSVYHLRVFMKVESLFSHSANKVFYNAILGGTVLAAMIFVFPSLYGEGYQSIKMIALQHPENLLDNTLFHDFKNNQWLVLLMVGLLVFIKAIATALTIGSGGNGGNFAPSLFEGAFLGFFFSRALNMIGFSGLPESNFIIVGMSGVLSGLYHAPLTSIFLIAEITGGYTLMIPLMIVSSISFTISRYFEPFSMDTKSLAKSGGIITVNKDYNILSTIRTSEFVETNFQTIAPDQKLAQLVEVISKSNRNIFPVTGPNGELLGVILLDNIREIIFKAELYEKVQIRELMTIPPAILSMDETMESVMKKFDETGAWNLPVTDAGIYKGFISKTSVFSSYRRHLLATTIA